MENKHKSKINQKKLQIQPFQIQGITKKIPISKIKSGKNKDKSISISDSIVAYIDILGFSDKKDDKDIEMCLLDFSGPLTLSASHFPNVRFNVFSDCAFVATDIEYASDLLSAIRFAFSQWISDGLLVRGGVAIGSYNETQSFAQDIAPRNYIGSLFAGSAVTTAVKLEGMGDGAFLFTNEKCAEFYYEKFNETIFSTKNNIYIGWSDKDSTLYWFTGISFLRLISILSLKGKKRDSVIEKLLNNIMYVLCATDSYIPWFLILAILSSTTITSEVRKKAIELLEIKDPEDFIPFEKLIDEWLIDSKKLDILKSLADSDSSIS